MKKSLLIIISLLSPLTYSQSIRPSISARIDTTKTAINKVYQLYKNYLNSKPDSIYKNPNWNISENNFYLKSSLLRVDRSANLMFNYYNSKDYYNYYTPSILQIDSVGVGRYQIKTIFLANCPEKEYEKYNPSYITRLYAVRNQNNEFKLENCIGFDTKSWKTYKYKFITYVVHPSCAFKKEEAKKAVVFCESISKKLDLTIKPFTYYLLPNSDELGKLYNFDYWLSYLGGQTILPLNEIFTTHGNENYPHEFVHILISLPNDPKSYCPMIISEGIATWLAGPGLNQSFEKGIHDTSVLFKKLEKVNLEDIISFKIRNEFDNSVLYVAGGVICKMVYEKKGKEGIKTLYNCNETNFKAILEELLELPYSKIDKLVIDYIKNSD